MTSLIERLAEFLTDRPGATIAECADFVLKLQANDELSGEDLAWLEKEQRRGLEIAIGHRLRMARVDIHGVSTRRLVAMLDGEGQHRWAEITEALKDPEQREQLRAHAWSVMSELCGAMRTQAQVLRLAGEPVAIIDRRVHEMVRDALNAAGASA